MTNNRVGDCTLYLTNYAIIAFKWYNCIRNYNHRGVQSSSGVGDCTPCLTFAFIFSYIIVSLIIIIVAYRVVAESATVHRV